MNAYSRLWPNVFKLITRFRVYHNAGDNGRGVFGDQAELVTEFLHLAHRCNISEAFFPLVGDGIECDLD